MTGDDSLARLRELRRLRLAVEQAYRDELARAFALVRTRDARRWALEQGYSVAATGRLPANVMQAYLFARTVGAA